MNSNTGVQSTYQLLGISEALRVIQVTAPSRKGGC
jgi:hypothetical protein